MWQPAAGSNDSADIFAQLAILNRKLTTLRTDIDRLSDYVYRGMRAKENEPK